MNRSIFVPRSASFQVEVVPSQFIMIVVLVAGGTGGVGHAITEALKQSGKHKVIVLSRKVLPPNRRN